jgi:hypothetical protein
MNFNFVQRAISDYVVILLLTLLSPNIPQIRREKRGKGDDEEEVEKEWKILVEDSKMNWSVSTVVLSSNLLCNT